MQCECHYAVVGRRCGASFFSCLWLCSRRRLCCAVVLHREWHSGQINCWNTRWVKCRSPLAGTQACSHAATWLAPHQTGLLAARSGCPRDPAPSVVSSLPRDQPAIGPLSLTLFCLWKHRDFHTCTYPASGPIRRSRESHDAAMPCPLAFRISSSRSEPAVRGLPRGHGGNVCLGQ